MTIIPSKDDPLIAVEDLAKIFSVKPYTVRKWIKEEKLAAVKIDRLWRVQKSEMIRFANQMYGNEGNS